MPEPSRTQKQIAEKYKGNLNYFKKPHFFRVVRLTLFLIAIAGGIFGILWFQKTGPDQFYNPAPLSTAHARYESNCASCHRTDGRDLGKFFSKEHLEALFADARHRGGSFATPVFDRLTRGVSLVDIDRACQKCHQNFTLHQPGLQTIALRNFRQELHIATAESCSACHHEHLGRMKMELPKDSACVACHGDAHRMNDSVRKVPIPGEPPTIAVNRTTPDGVIHFVPPQITSQPMALFSSFETDHPKFDYERPGLRDPGVLRFNHQRHAAADIPPVNGKKIDCAYCHKPSADGIFYQKISYEASCQACHSLQFDPMNPELKIPHGDPDKVRAFLRSLPFQYSQMASVRKKSAKDAADFVNQQMLMLKERVRSGEDFEKQIFFTADPYKAQSSNSQQTFFPGCAYCHEVKATPAGDPLITKTLIADRWLSHGPFTHAKHTTISCEDCHKANQSKETADIILPSKESCVKCHSSKGQAASVSSCLACHRYHAPVNAVRTLQANTGLKELIETGTAQ